MDAKKIIKGNFHFICSLLDSGMIKLSGLSSEAQLAWENALQGDISKLQKLCDKTNERLHEFKNEHYDRPEMQKWANGMANHMSILRSNLVTWLELFKLLNSSKRRGSNNGKKRSRVNP